MRPAAAALFLLIAALFCAVGGCSKMQLRSPSIVPPVEEPSTGEWIIKRVGMTGEGWRLVAVYQAESGDPGLEEEDLGVTLDGRAVTFSFSGEKQRVVYAAPRDLSPGPHRVRLAPGPDTKRPFPSLTIEFLQE